MTRSTPLNHLGHNHGSSVTAAARPPPTAPRPHLVVTGKRRQRSLARGALPLRERYRDRDQDGANGTLPVVVAVLVVLSALSIHSLVRGLLYRMTASGSWSQQQQTVMLVLYPIAIAAALAYFVAR